MEIIPTLNQPVISAAMMPAYIYAPLPVIRQGIQEWLTDHPSLQPSPVCNLDTVVETSKPGLFIACFSQEVLPQVCTTLRHVLKNHALKTVFIFPQHQALQCGEKMIRSGAKALLLADIDQEQFLKAIQEVENGSVWIDSTISQRLIQKWSPAQHARPSKLSSDISQREQEVLQLIVKEELTNEQIADRLFISKRTVDTHRQNLLRKTGARNTVALVKYALQHLPS